MTELLNKEVKHKTFGKGKVIEHYTSDSKREYVVIQFKDTQETFSALMLTAPEYKFNIGLGICKGSDFFEI